MPARPPPRRPAVLATSSGAQRAVLAQVEGQRTRVDPGECRDPVLREPLRPVGPTRLPHDHAVDVRRPDSDRCSATP